MNYAKVLYGFMKVKSRVCVCVCVCVYIYIYICIHIYKVNNLLPSELLNKCD